MFDGFQKAEEQSKPPFGVSLVCECWRMCSTHPGLISEFLKTAASRKILSERCSLQPLWVEVKMKKMFSSLLFVNELQSLGAELCFHTFRTKQHI